MSHAMRSITDRHQSAVTEFELFKHIIWNETLENSSSRHFLKKKETYINIPNIKFQSHLFETLYQQADESVLLSVQITDNYGPDGRSHSQTRRTRTAPPPDQSAAFERP